MTRLRYRAVLFDLDGTLIDSSVDIVASVRYALRMIDEREPPGAEEILQEVGKPLELIVRNLGYAVDASRAGLFVDTYRAHYAEHFSDHTMLYPGVKEMLGEVRNAGAKLALVTTKHQTQADFTIAHYQLGQFFDYVHGYLDGRRHKPDPEPAQIATARIGIHPRDTIMVGDSEFDIETGRAAGTATCAVTYGFRPVQMLRCLRPDFIVSNPADIAGIIIER